MPPASLSLTVKPESANALWSRVRANKPLVQCITNFVSMDIMANVLLAAGASPTMAHSLDEVEDFVTISDALLINMGTLDSDWLASKKLAAQKAVELGKPWVLDPVGCGATTYRTMAITAMLQRKPTVIRGNGSEILALAGASGTAAGRVKGVDSTASSSDAILFARDLAARSECIVGVSGKTDYITDGELVVAVGNGVEMMTYVTAAGCSLTALAAAFISQVPRGEALLATAHALALFGLASEEALKNAERPGPGSLRTALLDHLYLLDAETVEKGLKVEWKE